MTVPPAAGTVWLAAEIVNAQTGAAACETCTAWPAIVTVPERAGPAFGVAVIVAGPDAVPPPVTASHGVLLEVVHAHPLSVATWTATAPPAAPTVGLAGDSVKVHGAAACWIGSPVSLMDRTVCRAEGAGFAPTRKSNVPLP